MKLCKDCKYWRLDPLTSFVDPARNYDVCTHPDVNVGVDKVEPVRGVVTRPAPSFCQVIRKYNCGADALLFEPRDIEPVRAVVIEHESQPSLWQQFKRLFT